MATKKTTTKTTRRLKKSRIANSKKIREYGDDTLLAYADEYDRVTDLNILYESPAGELMVDALMQDVITCVDKWVLESSTLDITEHIALAKEVGAKLALVRSLTRSGENKDQMREVIDSALRM